MLSLHQERIPLDPLLPPSSESACDTCTFQSLHVACYIRPGLLLVLSAHSQFCVIAMDTRCWLVGRGKGEGSV